MSGIGLNSKQRGMRSDLKPRDEPGAQDIVLGRGPCLRGQTEREPGVPCLHGVTSHFFLLSLLCFPVKELTDYCITKLASMEG